VRRFSFPTDIRFAAGARSTLPDVLAELGIERPLVVTDAGVATLPMFEELVGRAGSGGASVATFSAVQGDPTESHVTAGVDVFAQHGADGAVGVGGGAAMDAAKAVALMATHPGGLFDYEDERPGGRAVTDAVVPIVGIPTTAGTGSEVGRSAVVSEDDTHTKRIIFGAPLLARVVLADPELTVGLPPQITAATGMDALTHNVEAYLAKDWHPICDGIALEGVRLVAGALPTAVAQPGDMAARSDMLMASMMGAIAFQKGLGLVHSCAHALGTVAGMHHGLANAVMIDHALPIEVEAVPERFAALAAAAGLDDRSAAGFLTWLGVLKAELGVPASLGATDVDPSSIDALVAVAVADGCHPNSPVPVTAADFESVFVRAFAS
jgi:alcohol dehydrogenase class IV